MLRKATVVLSMGSTTSGVVIVGLQVISLPSFLLSHLKLEARKPRTETDPIVPDISSRLEVRSDK